MQEIFHERELVQKFEALEKLLGENFNPQKTFELHKDLDENNKAIELGNCRVFWTEFRNPNTCEAVEGKIYCPNGAKDYKKILIVCPGYKGDFVIQESLYADDFATEERVVIVLRHNGAKIQGMEVENYIHCPEKQIQAQQKGQNYLGDGKDFSFKNADREILTVLIALGEKIERINQIDVIGHSWGGRIAIQSIAKLNKGEDKISEQLKGKIKNLILLAPWLETRKELLGIKYKNILKTDAQEGYFKNMNIDAVLDDLRATSDEINRLSSNNFPKGLRIIGIQSVADEYTMADDSPDSHDQNQKVSGLFGFLRRLKKRENTGNIILKNLKNITEFPKQLGSRQKMPEVHDYHLDDGHIRKIIKKIINHSIYESRN